MSFPFAIRRKNQAGKSGSVRASRWFRPMVETLEGRITPAATGLVPEQGLVTGTVYRDLNANGVQDANEQGLSDRIIHADANSNRQVDQGEITTATDAKGAYALNLAPGDYLIRLDPIPGLTERGSSPTAGGQEVTVTAGSTQEGLDFGRLFLIPAVPLPEPTLPFPDVVLGNEHYVQDLYRKILGRNAEPAGLIYWVGQLPEDQEGTDEASHSAREVVAARIWSSAEHRGLQVESCYNTLLERIADATGKGFWVAALQSGMSEADLLHGFLNSAEYQARAGSDAAFVTALYDDLLGRVPDANGLASWQQGLQAGLTRDAVIDGILYSTEALSLLVNSYYAAFLNRPADATGTAHWLAVLQQRDQGVAKVGTGVLASREKFQAGLGAVLSGPLPGPITVNSTADTVNQGSGTITLRDAITLANKSAGPDTIILQPYQTYNLDQIDNYWYGPNGLPAISSEITIQGNGATLNRSGGPNFRFFYVSNQMFGGLSTGKLTLQGLTLQGGVAQGGSSYQGGGGLGAGGAIFNAGTVVLDSVLLVSNAAYGGSTADSTDRKAGGGIGAPAGSGYCAGGGFGGPLPGATSPDFAATGGAGHEGQGATYRGGPCETINSEPTFAGFGGGGESTGFMNGGFGGGGGGVPDYSNDGIYGKGGFGGGYGATYYSWASARGGGGGGMGGAVFNRLGTLTVVNSTLTQNHAQGGDGATHVAGFRAPSGAGSGFGGGIFNLDGTVNLINATIARNDTAAGGGDGGMADGYQVYNLAEGQVTTLTLANSILAGASDHHDLVNQTGADGPNALAKVTNAAGVTVATNIIPTQIPNLDVNFNAGGKGMVTVAVVTVDSKPVNANLGNLYTNGGWTRSIPPNSDSKAINGGLASAALDAAGQPLAFDQRGAPYGRIFSGQVDIGAYQTQHYQQYPAIARLAYFDPASGLFLPFQTQHDLTNSTTAAKNVYVVSHGWMAGYDDWVNAQTNLGELPRTWQTWQSAGARTGLPSNPGPTTSWLFEGSNAYYAGGFTINASGLAQQILTVDPNAQVLAFSWVDESTTPTKFNNKSSWAVGEDGFKSEANTTMAGKQLAEGLMEALATNYHEGLGKVHLIGHSHGSRVATVAALTLQQAAAQNTRFDVVRQLTVLDSPEDNSKSYPGSHANPVFYQDTANFDWFYLAQLDMPSRREVQGMAVDKQREVKISGANTQYIQVGWGVTGPGIPVGTTIESISPSHDKIVLSAPVHVKAGDSGSIDLLCWDWSNHAIFVDSYISYFGADLSSYDVKAPDSEIDFKSPSLFSVVNTHLNPVPILGATLFSIALDHEYAATWYAGSTVTKGTDHRTGLLWSPLIEGSNAPPPTASQDWPSVDADHQFRLTGHGFSPRVNGNLSQVTLNTKSIQGVVSANGQPVNGTLPTGVKTVTLSNGPANSIFDSQFDNSASTVGFAFTYSFSSAGDLGSQLQILLNGQLYFAMEGAVAVNQPSNGQFSATFGLGSQQGNRTPEITLQLVNSRNIAQTVTISDFQVFTIG